jgi:hypothetical protein
MAKTTVDTDNRAAAQTGPMAKLLTQYGCGPVKFSVADEALYERHLLFDSVTHINVAEAQIMRHDSTCGLSPVLVRRAHRPYTRAFCGHPRGNASNLRLVGGAK